MNSRIGVAVSAGLVAGTALAPPILLRANYPLAAFALRSFFSELCNQDPARSFLLTGTPIAVCVRCFGIYLGTALGALLSMLSGAVGRMNGAWARDILLATIVLNILDVAAELLRLHGNLPIPRFFLGVVLGITIGVLLTCEAHDEVRARSETGL
jgi:uncharacterized membrane protein